MDTVERATIALSFCCRTAGELLIGLLLSLTVSSQQDFRIFLVMIPITSLVPVVLSLVVNRFLPRGGPLKLGTDMSLAAAMLTLQTTTQKELVLLSLITICVSTFAMEPLLSRYTHN